MQPLRPSEHRQTVAEDRIIEIPIRGMDCASCVESVRQAIAALPGVHSVEALFSAEKAIVQIDPARANAAAIRAAIEAGGFTVPPPELEAPAAASASLAGGSAAPGRS